MTRSILIVALLGTLGVLPGCIAWEIRDEIKTTNQHLCEVNPALVHTLHGVEETNQEIQKTQAQLAEVQAALAQTQQQVSTVQVALAQTQQQLTTVQAAMVTTDEHLVAVGGTLGQTNPMLTDLEAELERMRILTEVHGSLKETNAALGPLGKAMGSLGGTMSFLGLADSGHDLLEDEGATPSGGSTGSGGAGGSSSEPEVAEAVTKGGLTGKVEESKRPDPLLGTWVLVYPPPRIESAGAGSPVTQTGSMITVISADGKFLIAEDGKPPRSGRWSRQGRSLTYTYDTAPPGVGGAPSGAAPEVLTVELLTLNSRTLTLRRGDAIRVHARP